jgi:hypothetical protein
MIVVRKLSFYFPHSATSPSIMKIKSIIAGLLLCATALPAIAETSVLKSLPGNVQKGIEETRAACRGIGNDIKVTSGDEGLVTFTVGGKQAVLVDPTLLCAGCYPGYSCSNRGTRDVEIYVREDSWMKVLSNDNITGDIFVSTKPGAYRPMGQELNALVVNLFVGNRECPTRIAGSSSEQSWEARSCVVRWNGTRFTYKPL